jgi:hypothetical protein
MANTGESAQTEAMPPVGTGSDRNATTARSNLALEANSLNALRSLTPMMNTAGGSDDSALVQGLKSARYSAIQAPLTGVSQIIDKVAHTNLEESTKLFAPPEAAKFGTTEWHAQQIGGAAGMILPFAAVALTTRGGLSKLGLTARAGVAAESGIALNSARVAAVAEQGLNGFIFDFALRPSDSNSQNFWMDRTKHGVAGAATFATLTASSIGLKQVIGVAPSASGLLNVLRRDVATGIASGVPAGLVASNASSLLEKGEFAGWQKSAEDVYAMSMVGGVLSAAHVVPGKQLTAAEKVAASGKLDGVMKLETSLARRAAETELPTSGTKSDGFGLGLSPLARGRELRGFASDKAETEAAGTPMTAEKINLGGVDVAIEYGKHYGDGSYKIKLAEEYGVNPPGTQIRFFPDGSFPGGYKSKVGAIVAAAKHPDGTELYTRANGDSVYIFPEARESNFSVGDTVEATKVEVLGNDAQRWHTTDNRLVEYHPDDAMPNNPTIGNIKRVDMTPWESRFVTSEGNMYALTRDGNNMKLSAIEDGQIVGESPIKSFVEVFPKELNITRHGAVKERTTFADGTNLLLSDGVVAFKYPEPTPYGDGRLVIDGIKHPDGWTRYFLDDGTIIDNRSEQKIAETDWVIRESRQDQSQLFEFQTGEKREHSADGSIIKEVYPEGHETNVGTVKEVIRTPEKYSYVLEDGTTIELPLRGGAPMLRINQNGGRSIINETRVVEIFKHAKPGEFGLLEGLEVNNKGEIIQRLLDHPELASVTTLGTQRFRFQGFAQTRNGLYRMLLPNSVLDKTLLPEDGMQTALKTGTSPYHTRGHETR